MHRRRAILGPLVCAVGFVFGPLWIGLARRGLRHGTVVDIGPLRERLAPYFDADLLGGVEVRVVERITAPGMRMRPAGLCLRRVVVITRDEAESGRFESVLFQELVHAAQMRHMGTAPFCAAYLGGWWAAGRSYRRIWLEIEAFGLQARFDAGESFSVAEALDEAGRARRGYGPFPTKPPRG